MDQQAAYPTVPVPEWVNLLEAAVNGGGAGDGIRPLTRNLRHELLELYKA